MTNTALFSIWLVPASPDRATLASLIQGLADRWQASAFLPHITVYSAEIPIAEVSQVIASLPKVSKGLKPFTLKVEGVHQGAEFFKAIYLTLDPQPKLRTLNHRLKEILGRYGDYSPKPHLSLLYKELSETDRRKIISSLTFPKTIAFNELGYIVHENWRIEHKLVGKWRYQKLCQM